MPSRPLSVTTTATQLAPYDPRRTILSVFNNGTDTVFIGEDIPSLSTLGYPILVNNSLTFLAAHNDEPENMRFIVANSGTQNVRVLEQYRRGGPKPTVPSP